MLTLTLSNGTKIDIGISLLQKAITIKSEEKQGDLFLPAQTLTIPLKDVRDLVDKGKKLADLVK